MDSERIDRFVAGLWDDEIVPQLVDVAHLVHVDDLVDRSDHEGGVSAGALQGSG